LITFYGPNVATKLYETAHADLKELRQKSLPRPLASKCGFVLSPGKAVGRLVGGNLSTFVTSNAGTRYEPAFDHVIWFWESGSRDWRTIEQLIVAFKIRCRLESLRGILVGKIGLEDELSREEAAMLSEMLEVFDVPALYLPVFGHGPAENPILPVGGLVLVDADQLEVRFLEPFVDRM
jgi:muramoyltetrapeptide carboxypeptidase LdcA involved in peptidoglycan recycling